MPADVAVYALRGNVRSQKIAEALRCGARAAGFDAVLRMDGEYRGQEEPIAAFYGYQKNHPKIMRDYIRSGRSVVFVDLGYWGRREGGRWTGYHKVAVNDRHPTAHFQSRPHDDSRLRRFGIQPRPWRNEGRHILLAGMSAKSAETYGLRAEEWERHAIEVLRAETDREIVYRPKPSWEGARPLPGTRFSHPKEPLSNVLTDCHAVVTHHSNVAIDGLVVGIPAFCVEGVAAPMARQDLSWIERPLFPEKREQWLADIAWVNWSVAEIRSGAMWQHLKDEGLAP